jgi:prepilin-type N-terminal cleavage/methylation domain-containing protein
LAWNLNCSFKEEKMKKGFTLIETLVAMSLVLLAVLLSARITVSVLDQTRKSAMRFRLLEKLDYYKNYLSSLSMAAPELEAGEHREGSPEFQISWRVENVALFLKKINLTVTMLHVALPLSFYKSKYIQEVSHD